jgi:hypothetical protein
MFASSYPRMKEFPPIDRCIYCVATRDLTKEHVLPLGIAGHSMVLERASCRACAKITGGIEGAVLEGALGILREKFGSPSRHKSRRTGISRRTLARRDEQGEWVGAGTLDVPVEQLPAICVFPLLNAPRIFAPPEAAGGWTGNFWLWQDHVAVPAPISSATGGASIHIGKVNPQLFARFLAKIAHGYAVAYLGVDGFTPFLPNVILDESSDPFLYVGGFSEPPANEAALHFVEQGHAVLGDTKFALVRVRLFASLGAPEYVVVAGTYNVCCE